ncbi:uncharacterized protein LOC123704334 [Colias croceus]|uniref:uncharacterized protein LOC123704334 n=1 Tax=Colias crocea TaxID=72248 RepID=UPI001E2812A4|nr:uncharacterized protein LOC123704334 [Colias croceus]
MFKRVNHVFLCIAVLLLTFKTCFSDTPLPFLALYSPGDIEYTDVVVRRVHDNLTLVCEVRGEEGERVFVWNYVNNGTDGGRPFTVDPTGPANVSKLERHDLQESDSGHYMCSSPPFSVTKYILVQPRGGPQCARGAFTCGARCVLAAYVCDGRADCARGEDESTAFCPPAPCHSSTRLNCTSGRCIPAAACCAPGAALCRQPACCAEHPRYYRRRLDEEDLDVLEYPPLTEDRHTPDEFGFIQSTIYTVTACALIFMIAVVLLVSALCKMHLKRAALRGYRHTAQHYSARYPPRYEATRLLDLPNLSPTRQPAQCESESAVSSPMCEAPNTSNSGFALSRLSSMFCTRYAQVPTQCDVEMTDVRSSSLNNSPTRNPPLDYRSPITNSDLYYTNPDLTNLGRDLNYMATPIEFFRRRNLRRNTLDRVIDHLTHTPRPLTLQLGRFQFSIPRFNRQPRPDTPDIAEINIDNLDFVRLNANDTYTLNGRTIRLLGADFENYPSMDGNRPPPYTEAMRYKMYGPPPEYLSREGINRENEATNNIEMPPCYDDLSNTNGNSAGNGNASDNGNTSGSSNEANASVNDNACYNGNASNDSGNIASCSNNGNSVTYNINGNIPSYHNNDNSASMNNNGNSGSNNGNSASCNDNGNSASHNDNGNTSAIDNGNQSCAQNDIDNGNATIPETISSVIDNLPAIDSDVMVNE